MAILTSEELRKKKKKEQEEIEKEQKKVTPVKLMTSDELRKQNGTVTHEISENDFSMRTQAQKELDNSFWYNVQQNAINPKNYKQSSGIFQKGAFDDGYQFGDVTKAVTSTIVEGGLNWYAGKFWAGVNAISSPINQMVAMGADALGFDEYADSVREGDKIFKSIPKQTIDALDREMDKSGLSFEENSILGGLGVDIVRSAGASSGDAVLSKTVFKDIGVNGQIEVLGGKLKLPVTSLLSGFSEGVSDAYEKGGNGKQAFLKGVTSAIAEATGEGAFGMFDIGGSELESKIMSAINKRVENETANALLKTLVTSGGEGSEEIITYGLNFIGNNINDIVAKTFGFQDAKMAEKFSKEEILQNFESGALAGLLGGSVDNIQTKISASRGNVNSQLRIDTENKIKEYEYTTKKSLTDSEKDSVQGIVENNPDATVEEIKAELDNNKKLKDSLIQEAEQELKENKAKEMGDDIQPEYVELSKKEKAKIEEQVDKNIEEGKYSTEKLETLLMGEENRTKYNEINKNIEEQINKLADLETKINNETNEEKKKAYINQYNDLDSKIKEYASENKEFHENYLKEINGIKNNRYNTFNTSYVREYQENSPIVYDTSKVKNEAEKAFYESINKYSKSDSDLKILNTKGNQEILKTVGGLVRESNVNAETISVNDAVEKGLLLERTLTTKQQEKLTNLNQQLEETTDIKEKRRLTLEINSLKYKASTGMYSKGTIYLIFDHNGAIYQTIGHELRHALEQSNLSNDYNESLFKVARNSHTLDETGKLSDYEYLENKIKSKYPKGTDIESELSAFLTQEYLFNDEVEMNRNFINELAGNKTLLDKFKQFFKDIKLQFTGTEYEKEVRKLQKTYEKMMKEVAEQRAKGIEDNRDTQFKINLDFENEYDNWNKIDITGNFLLGTTSKALKSIGLENREIYIDKGKILKILNNHSGMNEDLIKRIPQILENPTLILKSQSVEGRLVVFGKINDLNGKPIMVAMELNPYNNEYNTDKIYKVASAYGRKKISDINRWISDSNNILYFDSKKNRTNKWLVSLGLQLPVPTNQISSNEINIPQNSNEVKHSLYLEENAQTLEYIKEKGFDINSNNELVISNVSDTDIKDLVEAYNESGISINEEWLKDRLELWNTLQVPKATTDIYLKNQGLEPLKKEYNTLSVKEDSNLDSITDEQYEYFKNTKAVNEDGELVLVHHGTTKDFNIFDIKKAGETGVAFGNGFYFTNVEGNANRFGSDVKSGYINIERPASRTEKTITYEEFDKLYNALNNNKDMYDEEMEMSNIDALLSNYGNVYENIEKVKHDFYDMQQNDVSMFDELSYIDNVKEFYKVLRESTGFDGIIIENPSGFDPYETYYVAFNPDQFKYKDNLKPTNNDNMRYSINGIAPYNKNNASLELGSGQNNSEDSNKMIDELFNSVQAKPKVTIDELANNVVEAKTQVNQERHDKYAKQLAKINKQIQSKQELLNKYNQKVDELLAERDKIQATYDEDEAFNEFLDDQIVRQINEEQTKYMQKIEKLEEELEILDHEKTSVESFMSENPAIPTKKEVKATLLQEMGITTNDLNSGKHINQLNLSRTDAVRVAEKIFGKDVGQKINEQTIYKVKHNEAERTRWLNTERSEIEALGIKARSKESAAVQKYGEGKYINEHGEEVEYNDATLAAEFSDVETQNKIKNAAQVLKNKYKTYIEQINSVLTSMGYDPIPQRQDYFRHFQELTDKFTEWGVPFNLNDMKSEDLPTDINGKTDQFRPGKQWFASALKRTGEKTTYDAITGIDGYLNGASNLIYHTEDIQRIRALADMVRDTYGKTNGFDNLENLTDEEKAQRITMINDNHLSQYAAWLDEYANTLANKKSKIDRGAEEIVGRRVYTAMNTLKSQVGSNMTGFNIRSALTNFISTTLAAGKTNKVAMLHGTVDTIRNIFHRDSFINQSDFLTSRFGSDSLSQKTWQKVANAGQIFMSGTDYLTSNIIVRSKYYEGIQNRMSEQQAMRYADDFGARVMGDRSKGATATIFNSKTLGILTQFQLETNNQLDYFFHDSKMDYLRTSENEGSATAVKSLIFQMGQMAAYSYFFNELFEKLTGSRSAFDPIDIFKKLFGLDDDDEDKTTEERIQDATSELLDTLPFTSLLGSGGRMPIGEALKPINTLFDFMSGNNDDYGNKVTMSDVVSDTIDTLPYYLLPTGYGQAKKTYKGANMYIDLDPTSDTFLQQREMAGSYTDSGNLRFEADTSPSGVLQSLLFGQWASDNAQDYIASGFNSLSTNDVTKMQNYGMTKTEYIDYKNGLKEYTKNADKFTYIKSLNYNDTIKSKMLSDAFNKDGNEMINYDSYNEYEYATNYPEKYSASKLISDNFNDYQDIVDNIKEIKENTSNDKQEIFSYIKNSDLTDEQKCLLFKMYYPATDTYNNIIVNYIANSDLSREEKIALLKKLKFTVGNDGSVSW